MVSIWWLVWAFLLGSSAGLMTFALASMAARQDERTLVADEALRHVRLDAMNLHDEWRA